jgi:hypothetical protein
VARSEFAERFGFAMWLRHLITGEAPSYAEIGRAVTKPGEKALTGQAVGAWAEREKAPRNWELHKPLATFFAVDKDWLVDDDGDPPRPELWEVWIAERRHQAPTISAVALLRAAGPKLTSQQLARAHQKAEAERREQVRPPTKKRRRGGGG